MNRTDAINAHAARRAAERCAVVPTAEVARQICRLIRRRMKRPIGQRNEDVILFPKGQGRSSRVQAIVKVNGAQYRVIYETATNLIVTYLPMGATP